MNDKTMMILIVLFSISSVYAYDRYQVKKTGVSPIGQLIDFAGLAQMKDNITERVTHRSFQMKSSEMLSRLAENQQKIKEQRNQLIYDRRHILKELKEYNLQIEKEAESFYAVLKKETERIKKQIPDVQSISLQFSTLLNEPDLKIRKEKFDQIKEDLLRPLEDVFTQDQLKKTNLLAVLDRMEKHLLADELEIKKDCFSVETCLENDIKDAKIALNDLIEEMVNSGMGNFQSFIDKAQLVEKKYEQQLDQTDTYREQLEEVDKRVESRLRAMVVQLVKITDQDVTDLIFLYQEMEAEKKYILDAMQEDIKKTTDELALEEDQLDQIVKILEKESVVDVRSFLDIYTQEKSKKDKKAKDAFANTQSVMDNGGALIKEYEQAVGTLGNSLGVDLRRLVNDSKYAMAMHNNYNELRLRLEYPEDYDGIISADESTTKARQKHRDVLTANVQELQKMREHGSEIGQ